MLDAEAEERRARLVRAQQHRLLVLADWEGSGAADRPAEARASVSNSDETVAISENVSIDDTVRMAEAGETVGQRADMPPARDLPRAPISKNLSIDAAVEKLRKYVGSACTHPAFEETDNGELTCDGFERAFGHVIEASVLRLLFDEFDTDKSGTLSLQEFQEGLERVPTVSLRQQVEMLMQDAGILTVLAEVILECAEKVGKNPVVMLKEADDAKQLAHGMAKSGPKETLLRVAEAICGFSEKIRVESAAAKGAAHGDKFQAELIEAAFGDTKDFREGLDQLGLPRVDNVCKGMEHETNWSADSEDSFETSNYGGTKTTPKQEWEFVMSPEKGKIYPGCRKPVDIKILFYALCAKRRVPRPPTRAPTKPSIVTWMFQSQTSSRANKVRVQGVTMAGLKPYSAINGDYDVSTERINGRPVYYKTGQTMALWWCKERQVYRSNTEKNQTPPLSALAVISTAVQPNNSVPLSALAVILAAAATAAAAAEEKRKHADTAAAEECTRHQQAGELRVTHLPAWVVGSRGSKGTDFGCMFVPSSEATPEQVAGKGVNGWVVAHNGKHVHMGNEQEGLYWRWQREFQNLVTVTVVDEDDTNETRWLDYKSDLHDREDQEAVEKLVLARLVNQLNLPILRAVCLCFCMCAHKRKKRYTDTHAICTNLFLNLI